MRSPADHHLDSHWTHRAACGGLDTELFYLEDHYPIVKKICRSCPVTEQCLAAALADESAYNGRRYGVRGGLSGKQRATLAQRLRLDQAG